MDYFARQNMIISPNAAELIKNIRILVVGVGAGGNEILKNLLLMGFGHLTIVDFDYVEDSNLSRTTLFRKEDIGKSKSLVAAERLKEMALHDKPEIVGLHGNLITDFGKGLFIEHDIVICCVDTQKCRAYINDMCVLTKTPFFEMGFSGYDVDICFFAPDGTMTQQDGTVIEKLPSSDGKFPKMNGTFPVCLREEIGFGNFDEKRNSCSGYKIKDTNLSKIPTIQISAGMAGVLVATELIKYLDGIESIKNKMLLYFGKTYSTMICNYTRSPKCTIHDEEFNLLELSVKKTSTIRDILSILERKFNAQVMLNLPEDFIFSNKCHICGRTININKRKSEVWNEERWCKDCREKNSNYEHIIEYSSDTVFVPHEVTSNTDNKYLDLCIFKLGVPYNDILNCCVVGEEEVNFYNIYLKCE